MLVIMKKALRALFITSNLFITLLLETNYYYLLLIT